jgi:hypothetical protein
MQEVLKWLDALYANLDAEIMSHICKDETAQANSQFLHTLTFVEVKDGSACFVRHQIKQTIDTTAALAINGWKPKVVVQDAPWKRAVRRAGGKANHP